MRQHSFCRLTIMEKRKKDWQTCKQEPSDSQLEKHFRVVDRQGLSPALTMHRRIPPWSDDTRLKRLTQSRPSLESGGPRPTTLAARSASDEATESRDNRPTEQRAAMRWLRRQATDRSDHRTTLRVNWYWSRRTGRRDSRKKSALSHLTTAEPSIWRQIRLLVRPSIPTASADISMIVCKVSAPRKNSRLQAAGDDWKK